MVYIQKNTPPPNKIMDFTQNVFSGGLNNQSNILEPFEASYLINMVFSTDEVMDKRYGSVVFDAVNVANLINPVVFIDEYKPYNSTDVLLRATSSKLYADGVEIYTVNGQISGENYNGKYYFSDGSGLYAYGIFHQTTTTYTKVIGTPITTHIVTKTVSPPVDYFPLDTSHVRGVTVVDYNINQVWYEPCQKELEDTHKGANVVPDNIKYIVTHGGRLFASGDNDDDDNVFISDVQNPYYFAVILPIQLPPNSDNVVGLVVYDDSVVVGRNDDIYAINGLTNRANEGVPLFTLRKLNTHTGFANNKSINVVHNFLFFLGSDGNAYAISSAKQSESILSTQLISKQIDLFKDPISFTNTEIRGAVSYFHDDIWYVSIQDKVLLYSYRHVAWSMFKGLNMRSLYKLNDELIWGDTNGDVVKFSNDYLDQGVPFIAEWHSKNFDMDTSITFKHFREFFLVSHVFNELSSDIRVLFQVDHSDIKDEIIVSNQISRWGISSFGDRFITRNINASFPFVIGRRGRYIKIILKNSYDVQDTVYTTSDLDFVTGLVDGSTLVYVSQDNTYYLYKESAWHLMSNIDLNQPMRVYEINGEYELRGKR